VLFARGKSATEKTTIETYKTLRFYNVVAVSYDKNVSSFYVIHM
jgi:hypothetical protein